MKKKSKELKRTSKSNEKRARRRFCKHGIPRTNNLKIAR
jgi:hypothetical protein